MDENQIPAALLPSQPAAETVEANKPSAGSVPLLQIDNNAIIHAQPEDVEVAVRSGQYAPQKTQTFIVKDQSGELSQVSGEHLKSVLDSGYVLESPEEAHTRQVQEKYGDQALKAFGESALSSATLGLSTLGQVQTGLSKPEDIAGREEANPIASTLGDIAGFGAGLFTGGTEAGIAKKVLGTVAAPAKAVVKAGELVEKKAAKELAKLGVEKTVAKSIVEKIAPKVAGEAVLGSALATGSLIHESALGKADFNAENLIAHAGMGAVVGGALGGAIGTAIEALPKVKLASDFTQSIVGEYTNPEKAALDLIGLSPSKVAKEEMKNPGFAKDLARFLREDVLEGRNMSIDEIAQKMQKLKSESGQAFGPILKQVDDLMEKTPTAKIDGKSFFNELASDIDAKFSGEIANSPDAKIARKKLDEYYKAIVEASHEAKSLNASELLKLRQLADDNAAWTKKYADLSIEEKAARFSRDFYNKKLKETISNVSQEIGAPQLADQFAKINNTYGMSTRYLGDALKKAAKNPSFSLIDAGIAGASIMHLGPAGWAVLGAKKFLESDTRKGLAVLGKLEKANLAIDKLVKGSVKNFFEPASKITKPVVLKKLTDTVYGENEQGKKPKNMEQAYSNFLEKMAKYQENPELLAQKVNRTTSVMYGAAPDTSSAVDTTAVRAMQFLNSKVPRRQSKPGALDLFKKPKLPSNMELAKFHRYVTAVDEPKTVLHDLENGTITHEGVEALQAVYPNLYEKVRNTVMERLQAESTQLSYNKRVQLGMLFGITADESMIPENILGLQANFQQEQPQEQPAAVKTSQKGLSELNLANREATETQRKTELT